MAEALEGVKPFGKTRSLQWKPMWEPLDSEAPRATLRLYAQCPVDTATGMGVGLFVEAAVGRAAEDTADCKC